MINSVQIIIYTESFVINRGLEFIFKKMRGLTVLLSVYNEIDFEEVYSKHEANFVLVSSIVFSSNKKIREIYKTDNDLSWGLIKTNIDKVDSLYNFEINLSLEDGEKETIQKINEYINHLYEIDSNSQNELELSNREKEILKQVALGLTNSKIAEKLFISQHTVVTHRKKITSKLGIKTISGLTVYALLNNLIEIGDVDELN